MDRFKICHFFLNSKNFWTMSKNVADFEKKMAAYAGSRYAVYVSSGSTANTLLAMHLKDGYGPNKASRATHKNTVIFPSTTWTTSVSPFIREGFQPKFIDINLKDFSMDLDILDKYLECNSKFVCCVFLTSLIGFVPDMERIQELSRKYDVVFMMDNCENTFGHFKNKNVSSFFTSSTSTYFGHQIQSVEGGFVFTNSPDEYDYFLLARNHGLTRSINDPNLIENTDVDKQFDFFLLGSNFRNSDIHAFIGLLDFRRLKKIKSKREKLYLTFFNALNDKKTLVAPDDVFGHSPFCLPILCETEEQKKTLLRYCTDNHIETRPIISGNLLKQTCYKSFDEWSSFPNSEYLNQKCFYVGLHAKVKERDVKMLAQKINTAMENA